MNSRLFVSIAVPVTAFSLTVAVLLWQRRTAEPFAAPQAELSQGAPVQPNHEPTTLPRIEEQRPPEAQAADASPGSQPVPLVQGESDPAQTSVPARLMVYARTGQSGVLATLQNMTADQLDVTITAVSAKTHMRSVIDVTLNARERKNLSTAGLDLDLGDQVTLQSSPYRDVTVSAR